MFFSSHKRYLVAFSMATSLFCSSSAFCGYITTNNDNPVETGNTCKVTPNQCKNVCDWTSLNHDLCNSRNNPCETTLSRQSVVNLTELWRDVTNPNADVGSTPVVENGIIYYATSSAIPDPQSRGHVVARDATSGTILWDTAVTNASITSSPVVTQNFVYVATSDIVLYKLRKSDGAVVASQVVDAAAQASGQGSCLASPVVVDNIVICGVTTADILATVMPSSITIHGSLNAFDANTLAPKWSFVPSPVVNSDPTIGAGVGIWSTPSFDLSRKLLFVGTGNSWTDPASSMASSLVAINYQTGKRIWSYTFTKNDVWNYLKACGPDQDVGASPNLFTLCNRFSQQDLVGVCSKSGVYRALDRATGKQIWSTQITDTPSIQGNPSAAVDENGIYVACAVDADGALSGSNSIQQNQYFKCLGICGFSGATPEQCNITCGGVFGELVQFVTNAMLGIPQNGFRGVTSVVKALDPATGKVKWSINLPSNVYGSVTVANGVLYVGDLIGKFRAINTSNGAILKEIDTLQTGLTPFSLVSGPAVVDGKVILGLGFAGTPQGGIVVYGLPQQ